VVVAAKMRWCLAVSCALLALLCSRLARQGSYTGPPFTEVPIWTVPGQGHAGAPRQALAETLRRAVDHDTPVVVRGGVRHWPAVDSPPPAPLPAPARSPPPRLQAN